MAEGTLRGMLTRRIAELETALIDQRQTIATTETRLEKLRQLRGQVIDNPDREREIEAVFAQLKDVL